MAEKEQKGGEFALIDYIKGLCATLPTNGIEGIGDDCAVFDIGGGESLLFTQDMLIERVHFLRDATSPYELGVKSLAVNLSDIAAMGGRAIGTLLSISIPHELQGEWIEDFMRGYRDLSAKHGVSLIGGDTTASKGDFCVSITAMGRCRSECVKRRSAARVTDVIATTGCLGASGAGLEAILRGDLTDVNAVIHRSPKPRMAEGDFLATECEGVRAMMDISDGVASDLRHILRLSGVGAEVELRDVPVAGGATLRQALCSGEDYELLMTIAAEHFEEVARRYEERFGERLYSIGRIVEGDDIVWLDGGERQTSDFRGFTHY